MLRKIQVENFKSVRKLEIDLGRVTVLIGANGSGKSNILESLALASAAPNKLGHEFLAARGIRTPDDVTHIFSAFHEDRKDYLSVVLGNEKRAWLSLKIGTTESESAPVRLDDLQKRLDRERNRHWLTLLGQQISLSLSEHSLEEEEEDVFDIFWSISTFLIYAPENRELRTFAEEGQILPLGVRGEGLFRLLKLLRQQDDGEKLAILKEKLQLIDWFEDFEFQQDAMAYERRLLLRDRNLHEDLAYIDQRSANEGFLFLLFYFCLFLSDATPPFFAIDNIDSSLNPKLCERLMQELIQLAKDNGKQVIVTTHNPAILDGLDLNDDEQRLYTVRRNRTGETIAERICAPKVAEGERPIRLSDAYLRGLLGGLPTNF